MPHRWKPEYDKAPFLKKFRILNRGFKHEHWMRIYPTKDKREFFQAHCAISRGIEPPGPCIWFILNKPFLGLKGLAWELSVFDAGTLFFNKRSGYTSRDLDLGYPSLVFVKRFSAIAPSMTFFKLHKTKQKIRSNLTA